MNTIKENANEIIVCLFELLVGILLLVNPNNFTTGIIIAFGVVLCVLGVISTVKYFRTDAQEAADGQSLFKGLVCVIGGIFCALNSKWIIESFTLWTVVYGIGILLMGLNKVQWTIDSVRLKEEKWFLPAISAAVSIVCAIVILINPFGSKEAIWVFTGISLILESVFDIVCLALKKTSDGGTM